MLSMPQIILSVSRILFSNRSCNMIRSGSCTCHAAGIRGAEKDASSPTTMVIHGGGHIDRESLEGDLLRRMGCRHGERPCSANERFGCDKRLCRAGATKKTTRERR